VVGRRWCPDCGAEQHSLDDEERIVVLDMLFEELDRRIK